MFMNNTLRFRGVFLAKRFGKLTAKTSRETDQPLRIFSENFFIHPWFVIIPLKMREGYEFNEIPITSLIFCEECEVVPLTIDTGCFVVAGTIRHICLDTNDGFYAMRLAGFIELNSAIEVSMVSKSKRRHLMFFCQCDHLIDL